MHRSSAAVAASVIAMVIVGCGSARTAHAGSAAGTRVTQPAKTTTSGRVGATTARPPIARARSGCRGPTPARPARQAFLVTLADNAKTYCLQVGNKLQVYLRGTASSRWLRPLVSGGSVVPIPNPNPAGTLAVGVTGGAFAAVHPGQVMMISARPPCHFVGPLQKGDIEPAFPLPSVYLARDCAPGHRFWALIIVRLARLARPLDVRADADLYWSYGCRFEITNAARDWSFWCTSCHP